MWPRTVLFVSRRSPLLFLHRIWWHKQPLLRSRQYIPFTHEIFLYSIPVPTYVLLCIFISMALPTQSRSRSVSFSRLIRNGNIYVKTTTDGSSYGQRVLSIAVSCITVTWVYRRDGNDWITPNALLIEYNFFVELNSVCNILVSKHKYFLIFSSDNHFYKNYLFGKDVRD